MRPLIVLVVAAFFYLGAQLAARLHRDAEISPLERAASAALLGSCTWIAVNWLLSAPHWLNRPALLIAGALAAIVALLLQRRVGQALMPVLGWDARFLLPLTAWLAFLLWRAYVLPIGSADALIYHMPRALLVSRAGGYAFFPGAPDFRINGLGANYELLLADVLAVQRADTIAEWTSILFFALFLLAATALARRWWGEGRYLFAVPYLVAAIPLVVLHAGAIKNDLMTQFFALSAVLWGGRWLTTRRPDDAALCIAALAAGVGTKNHVLLLAGVWGIVFLARGRWSNLVRLAPVALAAFLLLGGVHYISAVRHAGGPGITPAQYGEWHNLWRFPADIFLAPFSSSNDDLVLPWRAETTPWLRYDLYGSHYGQLVTIALPLLALFFIRDRRANAAERYVGFATAALFFFLIMPFAAVPRGFASPFARYVLVFPVVILCATVVPLFAAIERKSARWIVGLMIAATALASLFPIADYAANDKWMPLDYVMTTARAPNRRRYPPMPRRAAMAVDLVAGPLDRVDVHGGHDTYLYPVYGSELRRDVKFIDGPSAIRPDARWVIVDRADDILWRHPLFRSAADWHRYIGRGWPSSDDLAVVKALQHDPRFRPIFYDSSLNQSVFARVH
jgi:hypothetical protein